MNLSVFRIINSWAGRYGWLDWFMIFSAEWLGYVLILGVVLYFFKNRNKNKEMLIVSIISALIARFIFAEVIRFLYFNPRPFMILADANKLINLQAEPSFPSGHATFYFALAMGVYLYNKKAGYAYFGLAGLIGLARIFVGVHWPLDVIAGAGLGTATAFCVYYFSNRTRTRFRPADLPS